MPPVSPAPEPATSAAPPRPQPAIHPLKSIYRFFCSVKLAVVLLTVIIGASAVGTVYESSFDAKVARAYVYNAWWFNAWLFVLCLNLTCSAFSRWPWQKRHTGFLLTHLGIIVIVAGAYIGRTWGIEGTMTLFKGRPPNNMLVIDEKVLHLQRQGAKSLAWPVEIIGRQPTRQAPWKLGQTFDGYEVELVEYAPLLAAGLEPKPVDASVAQAFVAAKVKLHSPRLNQTIERWLLADATAENSALNLGLANVRLRPLSAAPPPAPETPAADGSTPPAPSAAATTKVDEAIMAFAQRQGDQVSQPAPGSVASGAKLKLTADMNQRKLEISWRGATFEFDPVADKGKDEELGSGSGLQIRIEDYWPDFELKDGKPRSISESPRNPAVLVRIKGQLENAVAAAVAEEQPKSGGGNEAVVYVAPDGGVTYELKSSSSPAPLKGFLELKKAINTGWADWQLSVEEVRPRAVEFTQFTPYTGKKPSKREQGKFTEGLRVRLSKGAESHEEWVPGGWRVSLPTKPQPTLLTYGFRLHPMTIGLELTHFEVERNEGSDSPAGFRSTLKVTDQGDGGSAVGYAYMNNPMNFPAGLQYSFTGLTYKISQASWNPDNLNQSSVQILRDPGWSLKWIGSLILCLGIGMLFYLKPAPKGAVVKG